MLPVETVKELNFEVRRNFRMVQEIENFEKVSK